MVFHAKDSWVGSGVFSDCVGIGDGLIGLGVGGMYV